MDTLPPRTCPTAEGDPEEHDTAWYGRLAELRQQHEATELDTQGVAPGRWVRLRHAEVIPVGQCAMGQSAMEASAPGNITPLASPSARNQQTQQTQQTQHTLESLVGQQGQIVEVIHLRSVPYALRLRFPSHPDEVFDVWVDCVETHPETSSPNHRVPPV